MADFYQDIPDELTILWTLQEAHRHIHRLLEMPDDKDRQTYARAFTESRLAEAIARAVPPANVVVDKEIAVRGGIR